MLVLLTLLAGGVALAVAIGSAALARTTPHVPKIHPPKPPEARTGGPQHTAETTVALSGVVNPHGEETHYYFQYGPTVAYGSQTAEASAGAGTTGVKVSQALSGLQQGATYHYRLVASSSASATPVLGADRTFTTKQTRLKFALASKTLTVRYRQPFAIQGTLTGTGGGGHEVLLQTSAFPYLTGYADLGAATLTSATGAFSLAVPGLSQNTRVRVRTLDALPAYSPAEDVRVAVLVTLAAHATRTPGLVRLTGSVTPAQAGAPVVFQLLRSGRHPTNVAQAVLNRGGSHFSAIASIRRTGSYRALVKVTGGRQTSGTSPTIHIRSTAPARKAHLPRAHRSRPRRRR